MKKTTNRRARKTALAVPDDARIQFLHKWQSLNEWHARDDISALGAVPEILDFVDSMLELHGNPSLSIARLGDGELGLATGVTVPNNGCQVADDSLKDALQRVLRCDNPACRIALPKSFFYREMSCVPPEIDDFVRDAFLPNLAAGGYLDYAVPGYKYLDASMTVVRKHYPAIHKRVYHDYYSLMADVLRGRDVILVTGDSRCLTADKGLLADAGVGSMMLLRVPQQNAWEHYDRIKQRIVDMNASGSRLVCLGCGPTATVLAYELADRMQCLDMGHMFVDYNLAMGGASSGAFWA